METKFYGNYVGKVVQNDDPDKMGRVKVFVPHISPASYVGWHDIPKDKRINFLGLNIKSDLSFALPQLKIILPWAELALPISGGDTYGKYNALTDIGTLSESPTPDGFTLSDTPAIKNESAKIFDGF